MLNAQKVKLFSIADPHHELESLVFINRPIIVAMGAMLSAIIAYILIFPAHLTLVGIISGIILLFPFCGLPLMFDKQKERYYGTLIDGMTSKLNDLGFPITHNQVMALLTVKSFALDKEYTLFSQTNDNTHNKCLEIYCQYTPMVTHEKVKKPDRFVANIVDTTTVEELASVELIVPSSSDSSGTNVSMEAQKRSRI